MHEAARAIRLLGPSIAAGEELPEGTMWYGNDRRITLRSSAFGPDCWYYARWRTGWVVSLDPAVVARTTDRRQLDFEALYDFLVLGSVLPIDADRTLLKGISRVPPGDEVILEEGLPPRSVPCIRHTSARLDFDLDGGPIVAAALREAVAQSVAGHDVVGVLVSGGLDSAILAALATEAAREVVLLSAPPTLATRGERELLNLLARHLRLRPPAIVNPRDFGNCLEIINEFAPHPQGGLFAGVFGTLADHAALRRVTIVLAGDGADDLFNPQGLFIGDALRAGSLSTAARAWLEMGSIAQTRSLIGIGVAPALARLSPWGARVAARAGRSKAALAPLIRPEFVAAWSDRRRRALVRQWTGATNLAAGQAHRDLCAAAEAAYALPLETRGTLPRATPYRSEAVLAAATRVGAWAPRPLHAGWRTKHLLREAAFGLLPDPIRLNDKLGRWDLTQIIWAGERGRLAPRLARISHRLPDIVTPGIDANDPDALPIATGSAWVRLLLLDAWLEAMDRRVGAPLYA